MKIQAKAVETERFQDYKYPSMFIAFPKCSFKCDKEYGKQVCQNSTLASAPTKQFDVMEIIEEYMENPITKAIVCGGLEPMDSFEDLYAIIDCFRKCGCNDDIIIYTGYRKDEISDYIQKLSKFNNIIIKFGRFVPAKTSHFDELLGVKLANEEQFAERIS